MGTPLPDRVLGIDFASGLLERMNQTGGRLFLHGDKPGVAEKAGKTLQAQYPGPTLCGTQDGYFKDDALVPQTIADARPDLLLVCLCAPKHEQWMVQWGSITGAALARGLGAAVEVFSGPVARSP